MVQAQESELEALEKKWKNLWYSKPELHRWFIPEGQTIPRRQKEMKTRLDVIERRRNVWFLRVKSKFQEILVQPDVCRRIQKEWNRKKRIGMNSFWDKYLSIQFTGLNRKDWRELHTLMPSSLLRTRADVWTSYVAPVVSELSALDHIGFEFVREDIFNGFDDSLVKTLVRNLHQSIFDYGIEIQNRIAHSVATPKISTQNPLATLELIDVHSSITLEQPWYNINEVGGKQASHHTPIITALKTILKISDGDSLVIDPSLKNLTYFQVHTGFVSWFAFDVIDNRFDIYKLPNMESMRAMMVAVASAGEARWPGKGRYLLQEVLLRTWYKPEFQRTFLSNKDNFQERLEAFLNLLEKGFDSTNSWSDARSNIIEDTFRLWSYLQSLQGNLVLIQPTIKDKFDPKLHEAYDQEGIELDRGSGLERNILWILCRGLQYDEVDGMGDSRGFIIRARVVVQ